MPSSGTFAGRPRHVLCLFDVDGTLTLARQPIVPEVQDTLQALRQKVVVGVVSGSDLVKITEQLQVGSTSLLEEYDYVFSENGLVGFKLGESLPSQSFIEYVGEERYKSLVNFILKYIADMDIPIKRGTFIEFRRGMVNVSPIGRNASLEERLEFQRLDNQHGWRKTFVNVLKEKFSDYGLVFAIGGQLSFDVFPIGWDKTYALGRVADEEFDEIHFFGDKTQPGGNDHEIFADPRTIGHTVTDPSHTVRLLKELFLQ